MDKGISRDYEVSVREPLTYATLRKCILDRINGGYCFCGKCKKHGYLRVKYTITRPECEHGDNDDFICIVLGDKSPQSLIAGTHGLQTYKR